MVLRDALIIKLLSTWPHFGALRADKSRCLTRARAVRFSRYIKSNLLHAQISVTEGVGDEIIGLFQKFIGWPVSAFKVPILLEFFGVLLSHAIKNVWIILFEELSDT